MHPPKAIKLGKQKNSRGAESLERRAEEIVDLMIRYGMIEECKRDENITILADLAKKRVVSLDNMTIDDDEIKIKNICVATTGYIAYI
jgi:hypothetical protein